MKRDWFEWDRFDIATTDPSKRVALIVKTLARALFIFFAPLVLVGNMWVFYALYEGIGLPITVGYSTVLFAGIFGYIDTTLSQRPHSQPSTLAWLYLSVSLLINLGIWAIV